jgi:hypothetical protein
VLGGRGPHPEDDLGPEEPEDVVEEGDRQQEDGEEPTLANDELKRTHSSVMANQKFVLDFCSILNCINWNQMKNK